MLWQRVVTAVVLLLVLLPALFYPSPEPFCLVALLFIAAGTWEWARLSACGPATALAMGLLAAALCALAWLAGLLERPLVGLWLAAAVLWVLGGGWLLRGGQPALRQLPQWLRLALGLLVLCVAWLAVALSIGSIGLLYWLIRHQAATSVASLFYLVPAVTSLMAFLLFDERLDAIAIAGMIACAAAVLVVNRAPAKA